MSTEKVVKIYIYRVHLYVPVYRCQLYVYPVCESAGTNAVNFGHVLYKTEPPFKPKHALVDTHLFREYVMLLDNERLNKRPQLIERVISLFSFIYG